MLEKPDWQLPSSKVSSAALSLLPSIWLSLSPWGTYGKGGGTYGEGGGRAGRSHPPGGWALAARRKPSTFLSNLKVPPTFLYREGSLPTITIGILPDSSSRAKHSTALEGLLNISFACLPGKR